jgi:hypothetical protein
MAGPAIDPLERDRGNRSIKAASYTNLLYICQLVRNHVRQEIEDGASYPNADLVGADLLDGCMVWVVVRIAKHDRMDYDERLRNGKRRLIEGGIARLAGREKRDWIALVVETFFC